jgi:membrane protein DedA with SNARE-associated domain
MPIDSITQLIIDYRYWILLPLTFIEGPTVAFVAGTMAAAGYFNIYALAVLFFVRDMGLDAVYYMMGYYGGRTGFAIRMLAKINITEDHLDNVRAIWEKHPGVTMFIGKLSYGIATAFIVAAGTIKMPLRTFFGYGFIVAILQYGGLLMAGYFLGASFGGNVGELINNAQYFIAFAAIVISGYYIFTWRMRKKFLEKELIS